MFVCAVISSTLKFEGICGETDASVTTALATQLSHVTVGMFSSAAFFELVVMLYTLLYALGWRARPGRYTATRLVAALTHGNMLYALSLFVVSIVNITFFVLPLSDGWNGLFITRDRKQLSGYSSWSDGVPNPFRVARRTFGGN
ncbi:hypothetical protein M404DRAFT_608268 [Pisolithus tinctorius Marx 270]|uniref:Uncharacterized protein n=1 Tax=Pisolithus tinctorius Marx 270 TaxID=870435 RepID=A0A0C3P8Q8_PISTI|nr:hypothetical protein M404DRAFT_608268 [Pisolithus tinctorius Marx 270]